MKKIEVIYENIVGILLACALGVAITMTIISFNMSVKIDTLENEVVEVYDKGYKDGYQKGTNDLLEDYYEVLIEYAILEERLKNQTNNEAYIEQMVDDFELVIELQQEYYQENITSYSFGDWLKLNHYELYKRIESYF